MGILDKIKGSRANQILQKKGQLDAIYRRAFLYARDAAVLEGLNEEGVLNRVIERIEEDFAKHKFGDDTSRLSADEVMSIIDAASRARFRVGQVVWPKGGLKRGVVGGTLRKGAYYLPRAPVVMKDLAVKGLAPRTAEDADDIEQRQGIPYIADAGRPEQYRRWAEKLEVKKTRAEILNPDAVKGLERQIAEKEQWVEDLDRMRQIDDEMFQLKWDLNEWRTSVLSGKASLDDSITEYDGATVRQIIAKEAKEIEKLREEKEKLKRESPAYARYRKGMREAGGVLKKPLFSKIKGGPAPIARRLDPNVRSALNEGRIKLRREAKRIYNERFKLDTKAADDVKEKENNLKEQWKQLTERCKVIVGKKQEGFIGTAAKIEAGSKMSDILGAVGSVLNNATSGSTKQAEANIVLEQMSELSKEIERVNGLADKLMMEDPKAVQEDMKNQIKAEAKRIANEVIAKLPKEKKGIY